jgi:hypothetical protein
MTNFELLCKILWPHIIASVITWFVFIMIWCCQLYNKTFEKQPDKNTRNLVKRKHSVTFNDEDEIINPKRIKRASILNPSVQFGQIGDRVVAKWPKFQSKPQGGPWFSGKLTAIDLDKRSCIIHYDDGENANVKFDDIWIAPNAPMDVGKKNKHSLKLNGDGGNHRYTDLKKMLKSYSKPFIVYPIMFDEE